MVKDKRQSKPFNQLHTFWIIGFGRFGQIALERIFAKKPDARITVVDKQLTESIPNEVETQRQDGIPWLVDQLVPDSPVDIIIPAIPVHVALEWIKYKLQNIYDINPVDILSDWLSDLPHPMMGGPGQAYVSHADFLCPDNCLEPEKRCTHTGEARPQDLFRLLAGIDFGSVLPIVIRSHQILPGVGGLYPRDLYAALEMVTSKRGQPLMIATACRCHGVVDFIQLKKRIVSNV